MNHLEAVRRQDKAKHISENPLQCTPPPPPSPFRPSEQRAWPEATPLV